MCTKLIFPVECGQLAVLAATLKKQKSIRLLLRYTQRFFFSPPRNNWADFSDLWKTFNNNGTRPPNNGGLYIRKKQIHLLAAIHLIIIFCFTQMIVGWRDGLQVDGHLSCRKMGRRKGINKNTPAITGPNERPL